MLWLWACVLICRSSAERDLPDLPKKGTWERLPISCRLMSCLKTKEFPHFLSHHLTHTSILTGSGQVLNELFGILVPIWPSSQRDFEILLPILGLTIVINYCIAKFVPRCLCLKIGWRFNEGNHLFKLWTHFVSLCQRNRGAVSFCVNLIRTITPSSNLFNYLAAFCDLPNLTYLCLINRIFYVVSSVMRSLISYVISLSYWGFQRSFYIYLSNSKTE